jgi:copper transport protein
MILALLLAALFHVTLVKANPAANSHVDAPPTEIRLQFSELIEAKVSHVSLVGPDGKTTALSVSTDPRDAHIVVARITDHLSGGTFRVVWHVVSADGHPVSGKYNFTVTAPAVAADTHTHTVVAPTPPPAATEEVDAAWGPSIAGAPTIPAVLRGLGVGTLTALAGLLFFLVTTRTGMESQPGRLALWLSVATVLFLGGHLATWLVNAAPAHRITSDWVTSALDTSVVRVELWRTLLALIPLWAIALMRRPGLALAATIPPLLLSAAVGHSAAFTPMLSIPLKALHLLALAAWLGGLLWLVVRERDDLFRFARETLRVSSIAMIGIIVVAVTGVIQTLVLVPRLADLQSAYGLVVLLKVAGLGVLAAFGAYHRFRVMPRLSATTGPTNVASFGVSLRREVVVMWSVVVLGGLLAYTPPPESGAAAPIAASQP